METAPPGFLRPRQSAPLSAAEDQAFARFCPALGQEVEAQGRTDHVLWGPYLEMRTGWATDPELRFAGASGGALSGLLLHLLDSGTVDAVVQIEADPDNPVGNRTVVSSSRADLLAAAGSRYAPSAPLARLMELVATGRRHAFVGKPCDVVALRALTGERAEVAAAFPVLLSFFCAGVPSETGGRAVLSALGAGPEAVARFRYRGQGWPGRATATLEDGSERSMSYHDSWGRILSKHVQHRCKICADGTGKAADLVCADAWECDAKGYPVFDEAEGVSLIVSRTELGARILKEAEAAGRVDNRRFRCRHLAAIQPGTARATARPAGPAAGAAPRRAARAALCGAASVAGGAAEPRPAQPEEFPGHAAPGCPAQAVGTGIDSQGLTPTAALPVSQGCANRYRTRHFHALFRISRCSRLP